MGVYEILPIILFVIQLGLIGYYIYTAIKSQKFISKNTIFYFVPISIDLFVLYTLGANSKEIEENINVIETYKYDHMIVENIRPMFKDSKYRIIKRG